MRKKKSDVEGFVLCTLGKHKTYVAKGFLCEQHQERSPEEILLKKIFGIEDEDDD